MTDKKRYVLGDWRLLNKDARKPTVSAVIGVMITNAHSDSNKAKFELVEFSSLV